MGLVSQNIDNLHLRGGCSKNICEIHGNMKYVRCTNEDCVGTTKMTRDMIVYKKDIQAFVQRMEVTPSVRYLEYTKKYGDPLPDIVSWLKDNETIGDVHCVQNVARMFDQTFCFLMKVITKLSIRVLQLIIR